MNAMNFLVGVAMANRLSDQRERMMVGLAASMYPASNPLGAIMLKPQIDSLAERESEVTSLTASGTLKQQILNLTKYEVLPVGGKAEYPWSGPDDAQIESDNPKILDAIYRDRKFILQGTGRGVVHVGVKCSLGVYVFVRRVGDRVADDGGLAGILKSIQSASEGP